MHPDTVPCCCFILVGLAFIAMCGNTLYENRLSPEAKIRIEVMELRKQKEMILWKKEKANLEWYLEQERKKVENE